jgi:PAS domain S-box-containing protein
LKRKGELPLRKPVEPRPMLRMSEQKYSYLYEESPSIMMIIGADGRIKDANKALLETSGYSRSEVVGKNALDFVVPEQREKTAAQIQAALKNGAAPQFEVSIRRKNGSTCTLLLPPKQLVLEEDGQRNILVAGIDITERNLAEQALRQQTRLLQKTFESAKGAIFVLDTAIPPNVIGCNQAASEIFGYEKSEMLGKSTAMLHVSDDALKQFQSLLYRATKDERPFHLTQFKMKRKDDSVFESEHTVSPLLVDGKRVGWVSIVRDITERVKYEDKLRALHQHALLLSSANNIDEMLNLTLNAMEHALGFDVADIYLAEGDSLNVKRTKGLPMGLSAENINGRGLVAKAARSQATVRVSDTSKEADYVDRKGWDWTGPPTMLSEIAVPIAIDGKTAGVLNVENTRLDAFNDDDQMLLETLAAHFAVQMQRLKHAQELRRSSQFLETIIENANVWLNVLDNENNVVIWNKAAEIISGYSREEVLGHQKIWSWLYPDDEYRKQITDSVAEVLQHGRTEHDVETNIRRKDGQTSIISWNERNLLDEHGKVIGSVAIGRDVSERKRMEEALANERTVLRTLIDNLPDNIFVKDAESRFVISNVAHARLLRAKTPDEIVGKTDFDIFPRELAASYYDDEQAVIRSGQPLLNREERTIDPQGKTRWLLTTKVPLRDDHGRVIGVAGINRDITERKRMQEELERYSKHLQELVEERTRKLRQAERLAAVGETAAMVGHDLRNPLQGIAGAAYNIGRHLRNAPDPFTKEMLAVIDNGVEYANGIINDLLEFSREMQLQRLPTTPRSVVTQALKDANIPDNVRVEDLTANAPQILVDGPKIRRVLSNLIKNAIDAMPEGGELSISSVNSQKELSISVKDTGVGISQDELKRIWTPLHTTKAKGIGLGLSICKRIVEAHGGSISIESVVGKGTTFTLKLPIERAQGGE